MICSIKFLDKRFANEVRNLVGNDDVKFYSYLGNAIENEDFKEAFKEWYKAKTGKVASLKDKYSFKALAKAIQDYYSESVKDVDDTAIPDKSKRDYDYRYGYSSFETREESKRISVNIILNKYNYIQDQGITIKGNKFEYYYGVLRDTWAKKVFDYICKEQNKDIETVYAEYQLSENKLQYIDDNVKDKTVAFINTLAIFKELNSQRGKAYYRSILGTKKLQSIYKEVDEYLKDEILEKETEDALSSEFKSEVDSDTFNTDTYINDVTNHIGSYSDFNTHVTDRIKNYFNTLPVLLSTEKSNEQWVVDTNNTFGMTNYMDAGNCSAMMYRLRYNNRTAMIESLKNVSKTIPEFKAFAKFAEDLENNPDFCAEVFKVFAKTNMERTEVVLNNGQASTRTSNERANPRTCLFYDFRNDIKSTMIEVDGSFASIQQSNITKLIRDRKQNIGILDKSLVDDTISRLVEVLQEYIPSISYNSVQLYCEQNNNPNGDLKTMMDNIGRLNSLLYGLTNSNEEILNSYAAKQSEISKLLNKLNETSKEKTKKVGNYRYNDEELRSKLNEIYSQDYITSTADKALLNIVDAVLPYSTVVTDLNSRNVYGNNSSSIINNSRMTQLYSILNDSVIKYYKDGEEVTSTTKGATKVVLNPRLLKWGQERYKSNQYQYVPYFLEQKDKNGEIIKGMFRVDDNGNLSMTEDAFDILKLSLFDGTSNMDNSNNAVYSDQTKGDFLPTSFISFFNAITDNQKDITSGLYFTRTPSDAPKTFMIKAPRINTDNLYRIYNIDDVNSSIKHILDDTYNIYTPADYIKEHPQLGEVLNMQPGSQEYESFKASTEEDIVKTISGRYDKNGFNIYNSRALEKINDDEYRYLVVVPGVSAFVFKGQLGKNKWGKDVLFNPELESVVNSSSTGLQGSIRESLQSYFYSKFKRGDFEYKGERYSKAKFEIDKNHPMFIAMRNQFKQELIDAATALDYYFEFTRTGKIKLETDENSPIGKIKPKFKADRSNDKGYDFYHLGENGTVLDEVKTKDGTVVGYKLAGNVFHSNKFTVNVKDENGKVTTRNFMDELFDSSLKDKGDGSINLLYGGAKNGITIIRDKDGVIRDVELKTDKQRQAIDEKLEEFIAAYLEDANVRINEYKNLIKGVTVNEDTIREYMCNNFLIHNLYDMLLEGNTKFYKNNQTVLKRAKEGQGSGVPLGIYNAEVTDSSPVKAITDTYLTNGVYTYKKGKETIKENVQDIFKGTKLEGIKIYTKFKGLTIKNTKLTNNKALAALHKQLTGGRHPLMTEDAANLLLYGPVVVKNGVVQTDKNGNPIRKGGFTDTKVNDAQSYITFEEWVRRITARGQLQRHLPLIKKILAYNPEDDNAPKITAKDIKEFVQVQKNFYYDIHHDDTYNIDVPRQIKNAEFVLIPQFIRGTELEKVYNMMKEAGIDQLNTVETSKAANEELLTVWDNNEKMNDAFDDVESEKYNQFVAKARELSQYYSYNNLYTQQETPQHMNSSNKAGIQIMKKIIDNLSDDDSRKKVLMQCFNENIFESYLDIMKEFDIPLDKYGNIDLEAFNNLSVEAKKKFYGKFADELYRRGMDSNLMDYVTLDEVGLPLMPSAMSNQIATLESAVQSIFNTAITRQRLPGFHAAQVTNVGFKALSDTNIDKVSYADDLEYHPIKDGKPQGYIEVKVPLSFLGIDRNNKHYKGMSENDILKELEEKHLDMIIGYRIPTEGKQSVCNMKIKGILDDSMGSTIVVPNDWVSQTGSDFDIDSVYAINFETYKSRSGEINKVKYVDEANILNYINWVNSAIDDKNKAKLYNILDDIQKEDFNNFINSLPANSRGQFKSYFAQIASDIAKQMKGESKADIYKVQLNNFIDNLENLRAKNEPKKDKPNIKPIMLAIDKLIGSITDLYNYVDNNFDGISKEAISKIQDSISEIVKDNNLDDYETYTKNFKDNSAKYNSRKARNNAICQAMQDILLDPKNLEENLSRSNFDKISEALAKTMNRNIKTEREGRSTYNVLDQIEYQEDAMSGFKLKAFSVSLDTLCSVCNVVKPTLNEPIYIVYNTPENSDPTVIQKNFFNSSKGTKSTDKTFAIRHTNYGYTRNNRNIDNMILTSYSSQTTAYILDAIKEGAIPNVNDYTFAVFKTLANVGCNYMTSVPFIMQAGITRIAENYKRGKSVFNDYYSNPIFTAIEDIAKELGIKVEEKTPITATLAKINEKYGKQFNEIFRQKGDEKITIGLNREDTKDLAIIQQKLLDRINEEGEFSSSSPVENKLLFDLGNILIFNNIKKTANAIGKIASCCNPDKFGAKQTVFSTNKVFDDIHKAIYKSGDLNSDDKNTSVLSVDGKHILEAIYPGISEGLDGIIKTNRIKESKYPSLYSFLKYSTATSIKVSSEILDTQNKNFVQFIKSLRNVFSGYNTELDEDTYKDFQNYVLNYYYKKVPAICGGVTYNLEEGNINVDVTDNAFAETERIYGYNKYVGTDYKTTDENGRTKYVPFTVNDLSSPTQEEINNFATLSPAQKVYWIKKNFDYSGIFSLLKVQLYNDARRGWRTGMQTIEFIDNGADSDILYNEFDKAIYNKNPLVKLAAIDLIKYAVQVEGMRLTHTGISKIISNNPLKDNIEDGGIGFVSEFRDNFGIHNDVEYAEVGDRIIQNYIRTKGDDFKKIKTVYLNKEKQVQLGLNDRKFGGIIVVRPIASTKNQSREETEAEFNARLEKAGIKFKNDYASEDSGNRYHTNTYVRFKYRTDSTLYKIVDLGNEIILYPLNKLGRNEINQFSVNVNNNNYPAAEFFDAWISEYVNSKEDYDFNKETYLALADIYLETHDSIYGQSKRKKAVGDNIDFNLEELASEPGTGLNIARNQIVEWISRPELNTSNLIITNNALSNYIINPKEPSPQRVKLSNGKYVTVTIMKVNMDNFNKFLKSTDYTDKQKIDAITKSPKLSKYMKDIIIKAINRNAKNLDNVFTISIYNDSEGLSNAANSLEDANKTTYNYMRYAGNSRNDMTAIESTEKLRLNGVENTLSSVKTNAKVITRESAKYANVASKRIIDNFRNFIEDPDNKGHYLPITDPRVIELIKPSQNLQNRYLKVFNETTGFINNFGQYRDFNIDSESSDIKNYIDIINKAVDEVAKLPINELSHTFNEEYYGKKSNNPIIREQVIDVMDNYWMTTGVIGKIHDVWENANPIVQLVIKEVNNDLESKRITTMQKVRDFKKKIAEFEKAGVGLSDVIDKNGNTIHDYSQEFVDTLFDLKTKATDAGRTFGMGSIQHLKAKNDYDMFKARHINQEAKPEYYINKAKNEKWMIDHHPKIFEAYMKLYYKKVELHDFTERNNKDNDEKIAEINKQINALTCNEIDNENGSYTYYYYDGDELKVRPNEFAGEKESLAIAQVETEDETRLNAINKKLKDINEKEASSIYDVHEGTLLSQYIQADRALKSKYFKYDAEFGFEDILRKNLNIMHSFELRRNGVPTVPLDVLLQNKQYADARNWVLSNARFIINKDIIDYKDKSDVKVRLLRAFHKLNRSGNNKSIRINKICSEANGKKGIKDEKGISNGNLLTDDELAKIKEVQTDQYNITGLPAGTDRVLISNASPTGDIYSAAFYQGMSGQSSNKFKDNPEYLATITAINKILEKYYDDVTQRVDLNKIPNTKEGIDELDKLNQLYNIIRQIKQSYPSTADKDFIEDNVSFETNKELYISQMKAAEEQGGEYYKAFTRVCLEQNEDGSFVHTKEGKLVPNKYLFSYAKPKAEKGTPEYNKWLDTERQEAIDFINSVYYKTKTEYYYEAMHKAQDEEANRPGAYQEWYDKNHVYNPYTRHFEPLDCWVTYQYTDEFMQTRNSFDEPIGSWKPIKDFERKVIDGKTKTELGEVYNEDDDMRNPYYKGTSSTLTQNYVKGSQGGIYDNKSQLSDKAKELRDYLENTMLELAHIDSAKKYFAKGYLPSYKINNETTPKDWIVEAGKMFGLALDNNQLGKEAYYDEIGYDKDITPLMPNLKELYSDKPIDVKSDDELEEALKSSQSINYKVEKPKDKTEDYYKWEDNYKKVNAHNTKISNDLRDNNWNEVIPRFIEAAGNFNAVLDNKEKLYQCLETLRNQRAYVRKYDYYGSLKPADRSADGEKVYQTKVDEDLVKQFETYIRRLLWQQFKKPEGKATRAFSRLQGFTSANYMMLNFKGGFANVSVGAMGIISEAAAHEYFNKAELTSAMGEYSKGIFSYTRGMYSANSYSLQDAIIKALKVVDYDEITGVCTKVGLKKWSERIRNLGFAQQSGGEHMMQNTVLFAMLKSNKLIVIPDDPYGIGITPMSEAEYLTYKESDILKDILDDKQLEAFAEFKKTIKDDKEKASRYAWFRGDLITDFMVDNATDAQIKEFKDKRKKARDKIKEEFKALPDIYSQLELTDDGYMGFKEGSQLAELQTQMVGDGSSNVNKAYYLIGMMSNKVKKVNNKIHGVYNKMGRGVIEQNFYGSIITQYHKHLPQGILKRWRVRGYFDETRNSVEKGFITTMRDFFNLNVRRIKHDCGLTNKEMDAVESLQFYFKNGIKILLKAKDTYHLVPEYERANLRRQIGDLLGTIGGLMTMIALKGLWDDEDSIAYNYWLYEADRLSSESFMYNPWGLYTEGKTLFSTPIAAQSIISDAFNGMYQVAGYVLQGEDFDNTYKSGRFAGENKVSVYIQRRIPMWSSIRNIADLPANNQYYKAGGKSLGFVDTNAIGDYIFK